MQSDFAAIGRYRQGEESCRYLGPPQSDREIIALIGQHESPWRLEEGHFKRHFMINHQWAEQGNYGLSKADWRTG